MNRFLFLLLTFIVLVPLSVNAQCKKFVKNNCLPDLEPYIYNGQLNSAVFQEGDIAEVYLTFYSGQENRLLICSQEILGNVEFRVLDLDGNVLFHNKDHDFVKFWDFSSNTTQQLSVQVKIPQGESVGGMVQSGCIAILVGFKE